MNIKFIHANILTRDFDLLEDYSLSVEGNIITKIEKSDKEILERDKVQYERIIDCHGNYLIPGFKNAHSHNGMVFARSMTDDVPLHIWLNEKLFPVESLLTDEDVYYFTKLGIMENLTSGITASADMYKYVFTLAQAYLDTGFRVNLVDGITIYDREIAPEKFHDAMKNYKGDNRNLIKYTLSLHAEYTNNKETFQLIADLVHKYKEPFISHNAETKKEVEECKERWGGLTPTQVNETYGLYDYGGGGCHCIYLTDEDIEIFKKHDLTIITNPASNLKLASGVAPIKKYMNNGIKIAIGTDGPASNNAISMFREMYLVSNLSKYLEMDSVAIPTKETLRMAITNGAKIMDMEDCDALEVGKKADIVLIDKNHPNMQVENTFINNLVYACDKTNVKMTMVDGRILYEDGKFFIGEDEEWMYKKCNELMKKLIERRNNKK